MPEQGKDVPHNVWWSALGRRLLQEERHMVLAMLARCPGQRALLIGCGAPVFLLQESRMVHKIHLLSAPQQWRSEVGSTLVGAAECLPFADESLDLVVLHHALDASVRPRAVLRESLRVLHAGGHLLILGFNPWSLWGLLRLLGYGQKLPTAMRVGVPRLGDWLELLDCELEDIAFTGFDPPHDRAAGWFWRLFTAPFLRRHPASAAVYAVLAYKRQRRLIRPPMLQAVWPRARASWKWMPTPMQAHDEDDKRC